MSDPPKARSRSTSPLPYSPRGVKDMLGLAGLVVAIVSGTGGAIGNYFVMSAEISHLRSDLDAHTDRSAHPVIAEKVTRLEERLSAFERERNIEGRNVERRLSVIDDRLSSINSTLTTISGRLPPRRQR